MWTEIWQNLAGWGPLDHAIVITGALAAMACALPGNYLVLRRQSMMGDALSHTALLGIVLAYLGTHAMLEANWITFEQYLWARPAAMFVGAVVIGIVSAWLTEGIQELGRVESSAALGVVFTSLFALGLLLIRLAADHVDLDPGCVLYGELETSIMDTLAGTAIPRAAAINAAVLVVNLVLVLVFYKELEVSAFDPALATTLGINARMMMYALMAVTAATLVAAFQSVGSILVIAMLIVPPATAHLLTDRLPRMVVLSLVIAAASAIVGHAAAISLPGPIFARLGFAGVSDASTSGMMAVACGGFFLLALVFAPQHGLVSRFLAQTFLSLRIVGEDLLGVLFRFEEQHLPIERQREAMAMVDVISGAGSWWLRLATWQLVWKKLLNFTGGHYELTPAGRELARTLVRSHRLWESYMAKHFTVPDDHLHATAHRVEHYIDPAMQDEIESELAGPSQDPHGRVIPPGKTPGT